MAQSLSTIGEGKSLEPSTQDGALSEEIDLHRQLHTKTEPDFATEIPPTQDDTSEGALLELLPQLTRRGTVNPDSPYFSTEKFLRNLLARAEEQGLRRRNAGVVFKSLVVLGYGSDYTHQNTVGTVATGVLRIGETIKSHRHPPMKTILYSMDGVVKEGEMLLVLGKPGSGATTLLKTIAGETKSYASVSGGTGQLHRFLILQTSITMAFPQN
jgi:ATPase subunit of ABC transporter with duplicated ATPase domains